MFEAFAVATPGLEEIVAAELGDLKVPDLKVVAGGVEFSASRRALYEANLHLRTASRVIIRLARFKALTFADLEKRAKRVPWDTVLKPGGRVALRVTCRKSRLYHSDAVAQRLERDLTERLGAVASRTKSNDDSATEAGDDDAQLIIVRLDHDECTISADSSGAHLHQRGYRQSVTAAPMRETLAAALVIASGWSGGAPLIDPFCGSGTIPIEAALFAARIAPGKYRRFSFSQWPGHDDGDWRQVLGKAVAGERLDHLPVIRGSDRSVAAVRAAADNAERAGVAQLVAFEKQEASRLEPEPQPGWIVSNPPYGVRLGDADDSRRMIARFGDALEARFPGWRIALMAPARLQGSLGIPLRTLFGTTNGGLAVRFLAGKITNGQGQPGV